MMYKKILGTIAVAGAVVSVGHINANAQTFNYKRVGNLGNYSYVHMREKPTVDSDIVLNLSKGRKVKIISEYDDWSKVSYDGQIGYISNYYLVGNSSNDNELHTRYRASLRRYVNLQHNNWNNISRAKYNKYINPSNNNKYEFLRVNTYRDISISKLNHILRGKGVLSGMGSAINNASREYNIDPVYLAAQTILETGYGESRLAKGVRINSIADTNRPIYRNGLLVGYKMIKLSRPVVVYNLYGIGARDNLRGFNNRAFILGTTYAYKKGWTSINKAIYGAAKFLSQNYIHNSYYNQNTPYKLRYIPDVNNIWHEYATQPEYAENIGRLIDSYKYIYERDNSYQFDKPVFS